LAGFGSSAFVAAAVTDIVYAYWSEQRRQGRIYAAFTQTALPGPPDLDFVKRPAVSELVRQTLTVGMHFEVIVGNHGTGKSTIVKKVGSTIPGVIYVFIEENRNIAAMITNSFASALNWEERKSTWLEVLLRLAAPSSKHEPGEC